MCVFAASSGFQVSRLAGSTCSPYLCAQLLLLVKSLRFHQQQQRAIEDVVLGYHSEFSLRAETKVQARITQTLTCFLDLLS